MADYINNFPIITNHIHDELSLILFHGWLDYLHCQDERILGQMVRNYLLHAPETVKKDSPQLFQALSRQLKAVSGCSSVIFSVNTAADIKLMRFWQGFGAAVHSVSCATEALLELRAEADPPFFCRFKEQLPAPIPFNGDFFTDLFSCYFDPSFFRPDRAACFVDGGALDLFTSYRFAQKSKGCYRSIYAFEPDPNCYQECIVNRGLFDGRLHLMNTALWDSCCLTAFSSQKENSRCCEAGAVCVPADTLDHILFHESPTCIKLHLEGAELFALRGARNIIRQYHPRLAVAIGHRKEDILEIPQEILSIDSSYHFFLRHYSSGITETVLYGI